MRIAAIVTFTLALLLGGFGYWGIYTRAGNRRFDEMAGMIPFGAGVLAAILFFAGVVLTFLSRRS